MAAAFSVDCCLDVIETGRRRGGFWEVRDQDLLYYIYLIKKESQNGR